MDLKSVPLSEDPNVASGTQEARLCDRAVCHQSTLTAQHNERCGILSAESIHHMAAMTAGRQQLQPCYCSKRDCSITSPNARLQRPFRPGTASLVLCQVCSAAESVCHVDCSPAWACPQPHCNFTTPEGPRPVLHLETKPPLVLFDPKGRHSKDRQTRRQLQSAAAPSSLEPILKMLMLLKAPLLLLLLLLHTSLTHLSQGQLQMAKRVITTSISVS